MPAPFIPEGFEKLDDTRERLGMEKLGASLAAGSIKAYRIDPWGEMKFIVPQGWRTDKAEEVIRSGRTIGHYNSQTGRRGTGDLIVVRQEQARAAAAASTTIQQHGRPKGTGFAKMDGAVVSAMLKSSDENGCSLTDAAWRIIGRDGSGAAGAGTPEAKVKRLVARANAIRNNKAG
jgi:hypothetical protein